MEIEALRERVSRLSAAVLRASASLDLDAVLREVVDSARALTGARFGVIVTVGGTGQAEEWVMSGFDPGEQDALVAWLTGHSVEAAALEGTGVYWHAPWRALTAAGIEVQLLHAQHVRQLRGRKTDIEDSRWLARVCQFGLGQPSFVPDEAFRDLRNLVRHRRTLVAQRSQTRNRVQKVLDRSGIRIGGVLSDVFGLNGRRILDGLVARRPRADILDSLSRHVRSRLELLGDALQLTLCETDRLLLADLIAAHDDLDPACRTSTGTSTTR